MQSLASLDWPVKRPREVAVQEWRGLDLHAAYAGLCLVLFLKFASERGIDSPAMDCWMDHTTAEIASFRLSGLR